MDESVVERTVTCATSSAVEVHMAASKISAEIMSVMSMNSDEDITLSDTHNPPPLVIQGPITRARA
jgi:hypothetical protein